VVTYIRRVPDEQRPAAHYGKVDLTKVADKHLTATTEAASSKVRPGKYRCQRVEFDADELRRWESSAGGD
jgi:hypothetical protein